MPKRNKNAKYLDAMAQLAPKTREEKKLKEKEKMKVKMERRQQIQVSKDELIGPEPKNQSPEINKDLGVRNDDNSQEITDNNDEEDNETWRQGQANNEDENDKTRG